MQRITIPEIRNHSWFLKNLPADLMDDDSMSNQYEEPDQPMQTMDQIMQILTEATIPPACSRSINILADGLDMDDDMDAGVAIDANMDTEVDADMDAGMAANADVDLPWTLTSSCQPIY